MGNNRWRLLLLLIVLLAGSAYGGRISDVRNTKHNLSASGSGTLKATTESQVCVFCHTPHAATAGVTPLWNRQVASPSQMYQTYTSSSLDANAIQTALDQPGGSSKLCLSCHDGTLAIGNVNVLNGQANATIAMTGTGPGGTMAEGAGTTTGFTRNLGTNLTNDHPISLDFTAALATRDGELRQLSATQQYPASGAIIGVRAPGYRPLLPLEPTGSGSVGQLQCGTCHDPHLRETDPAQGNQKFLRANRFQEATPGATYSQAGDIFCLACHEKNQTSGVWAYSAHANPLVATQTYKADAAAQRDFPSTLTGSASNLPVWKAACLNCHDTHTVQGARRLLREGTDSTATPKAGGNAALEETCFRCHTTSTESVITPTTTVPDIRTDYQLLRRMPIRSTEQLAGTEVHEIGGSFNDGYVDCSGASNQCGKDLIESRAKLGHNDLTNRHAECTDCHNPHRVVKFRDFRGNPLGTLSGAPDPAGTHRYETTGNAYVPSNVISGVLRGAWGVEPTLYASNSFHSLPTNFAVKRGDPGSSVSIDPTTATYVTREYQICLKCHSNYAYNDDNAHPNSTSRPQLGGAGLTPVARANDGRSHTTYTNQAKEFQAPASHAVRFGSVNLGSDGGTGTAISQSNNNNRSWHPVTRPTGRTTRVATGFLPPWNNTGAIGSQTMYCSDCHGSGVTGATSIAPVNGEDGSPWGPHGSDNNFLLKGLWNQLTGAGNTDHLCFKCHAAGRYAGNTGGTGFNTDKGDGHDIHVNRIAGRGGVMRCNFCHVAVPHGWKNRSLLVNLNDVGPEANLAVGTSVTFANNVGYTNGPYYRKAFARITSFPSGQWTENNCNGGKDAMRTQCGGAN